MLTFSKKLKSICVVVLLLFASGMTLSACGSADGQKAAAQSCTATIDSWKSWYSSLVYSSQAGTANQTINSELGGYSGSSGQGGTISLNAYVQSEVVSPGSVQSANDMCDALKSSGNDVSNLPQPPSHGEASAPETTTMETTTTPGPTVEPCLRISDKKWYSLAKQIVKTPNVMENLNNPVTQSKSCTNKLVVHAVPIDSAWVTWRLDSPNISPDPLSLANLVGETWTLYFGWPCGPGPFFDQTTADAVPKAVANWLCSAP